MDDSIERIGFIGTGVMGVGMASNLLEAGYSLRVFNRTPAKAEPLVKAGAVRAASVADAAANADMVITIVGYPEDVREVILGTDNVDGVLATAPAGCVVADMTTSEPALAKELYAKGKECGVAVLDAPVSGGDVGAREGTLSIMVGGDADAFRLAEPVFKVMGRTVVHQGRAGSGQHTKMANQIAIASTMLGVMEALRYAVEAGLEPDTVLESIGAGAAGSWSMSNMVPRVVKEDYAPGFAVRHFVKDLNIAEAESAAMDLQLAGLALAARLYRELEEEGRGGEGTQAIYRAVGRGEAAV